MCCVQYQDTLYSSLLPCLLDFCSLWATFICMEARERTLRTYESADGRVPFNEWLAGLRDRKARAIIRTRLDRVSLGLLGDYKSVGGGVQELRISYGSGYRVYFAQVGDIIIILLCGGDKSSQQQDIERAKNYWDDYRSREDA